MDLRLYDTAKDEVVELAQREPGKVSIYACGPTVYDLPHIGHGRMVLTYDIFRRYLESQGIEVEHVSNITDIEDKIINRAKEQGVAPEVITTKYEAEWYAAMDRLGVLRPKHDPHATAYVGRMVELIEELLANGYAYETSDTIYFQPEKVKGYGLLAKQSVDSLRSGARVEQDEEKQSPIDFALWKKVSADEPHWESPWGPGRPGWHTECVVMSLDILGDGFDLHTGGQDLMFPHHENERAQAVALGKTFARHWMHNGFVEMGGEKMSKSLGNFTSLTDLLARTDPRAYRLLVLRSHYRSPIEVTPETIADAEAGLGRLDDFARRFFVEGANATEGDFEQSAVDSFNGHMNNDLDTPGAVADVFTLIREANADADAANTESAVKKARAVLVMCAAVGLFPKLTGDAIDDETASLITRRDEARASKNWSEADQLRSQLEALGWTVKDSPTGTQVHK